MADYAANPAKTGARGKADDVEIIQQERKRCHGGGEPACHTCGHIHRVLGVPGHICQNTHSGYNGFFRCETGEGRRHRLPLSESQRCENHGDHASDGCEDSKRRIQTG